MLLCMITMRFKKNNNYISIHAKFSMIKIKIKIDKYLLNSFIETKNKSMNENTN